MVSRSTGADSVWADGATICGRADASAPERGDEVVRIGDGADIEDTGVVGAAHDTMDPEHMRWVSTQVKHGSFLLCPQGSHLAMWDDQRTYAAGLVRFLKRVDAGT